MGTMRAKSQGRSWELLLGRVIVCIIISFIFRMSVIVIASTVVIFSISILKWPILHVGFRVQGLGPRAYLERRNQVFQVAVTGSPPQSANTLQRGCRD